MKKILLTFMCTIALMLSAQFAAAQEIKMSDDGLTCTYTKADPNAASAVTVATNEPIYRAGNTYILGKQTMDKYQYAAYLRNSCPAAYAKFHSGYTLSSVGWGLLAGGLALGIDATFIKSDMFESIPRDERFDIIVSNPPYIKSNVIETLMSEVKDYEPMSALDGSEDGLKFYRIIADRAPEYLNNGGMLFLEIGYDQGEEVSALITEAGFTDVQVIKDLSGLDRVVSGRIGLI